MDIVIRCNSLSEEFDNDEYFAMFVRQIIVCANEIVDKLGYVTLYKFKEFFIIPSIKDNLYAFTNHIEPKEIRKGDDGIFEIVIEDDLVYIPDL